MYAPKHFAESDPVVLRDAVRRIGAGQLITVGSDGPEASFLPLLISDDSATVTGHLAKGNGQWARADPSVPALVTWVGPDAYVSPSYYPSKQEHGKVVPTWNYIAVHAYGPVEFFDDAERLHDVVSRLTNLHERPRAEPWAVTDAPAPFIKAQLNGIVGLRLPITRIEGKRKLSQNRNATDRAGVAAGLAESQSPADRLVAALIPR